MPLKRARVERDRNLVSGFRLKYRDHFRSLLRRWWAITLVCRARRISSKVVA